MKEFTYGHAWWNLPDLDVAVREVSEVWLGRLIPTQPIHHTVWVLDYVFTEGLKAGPGSNPRRWLEFGANTARLMPAQFQYRHDTRHLTTPVHAAWMGFRGGEKLGLIQLLDKRSGWAVFHDPKQVLGQHLHAMAEFAASQNGQGYWKSQADLYTAIHMLTTSTPRKDGSRLIAPQSKGAGFDPLVSHVRTYLGRHLAEPVTRQEIAASLNMSVSSLAHRYSKLAGEGVQETLHRMRFDLARDLLRKGETVKVVAERAGFSSIYHFSKAFKHEMGIPPSQFAKKEAPSI